MSSVILVTGASRGLGAAVVEQLSSLGCRVLATARSQAHLETLWSENPQVDWIAADLSEPEQIQELIQDATGRYGKLDGLVNNAGTIDPIQKLADADPHQWARSIQVNLTAPALLTRAALPLLEQNKGRVVNISSGAAIKSVQGWSAYCTAKAGLTHLTRVAAVEYPNVGFFSLRPGVIDTQMQQEIRESSGMTTEEVEKFRGLKAEGKLEPPKVPARAICWLLLHGPTSRSGEFIEYTDPEVKEGVDRLFST